jgi:hypothetical protein
MPKHKLTKAEKYQAEQRKIKKEYGIKSCKELDRMTVDQMWEYSVELQKKYDQRMVDLYGRSWNIRAKSRTTDVTDTAVLLLFSECYGTRTRWIEMGKKSK